MILVDTSVWVDHLRRSDAALAHQLKQGRVLSHPFVIGELALGHLPRRAEILEALTALPAAMLARDSEMPAFIERHGLAGRGIGYIDAHLLASVRLTPEARLWTRDRRLLDLARALDLAVHDET